MARRSIAAIVAATALAIVAFGNSSFGQGRSHVAIGNLILSYDPSDWQLSASGDRIVATSARRDGGTVSVIGTVTIEPGSGCSGAASLGEVRKQRRYETFQLRAGLALRFAETDLGCRNLVPRRVLACVAHAGRVYRFSSGPLGCRSAAGRGTEQATIDLLKTLAQR